MSTLQGLLDLAINDNLLYGAGTCSGGGCGSGCCGNNCLQYSSLVARVGIFQTIHLSNYNLYSNVIESCNCFGQPLIYSTISARHGIFSTFSIVSNVSDFSDYVTIPNSNAIDSNGFVYQYDIIVVRDAFFYVTSLNNNYASLSSVCQTFSSNVCTSGPTGPRGVRGFTGPMGPMGPTGQTG